MNDFILVRALDSWSSNSLYVQSALALLRCIDESRVRLSVLSFQGVPSTALYSPWSAAGSLSPSRILGTSPNIESFVLFSFTIRLEYGRLHVVLLRVSILLGGETFG